jgi:hypothetical protein
MEIYGDGDLRIRRKTPSVDGGAIRSQRRTQSEERGAIRGQHGAPSVEHRAIWFGAELEVLSTEQSMSNTGMQSVCVRSNP